MALTDDDLTKLGGMADAYAPANTPDAPMPVPPMPPTAPEPQRAAAPFTISGLNIPASYGDDVAMSESGNRANAKNPLSSASGRYQITDGTLQTILANHPELHGVPDPKNDSRVFMAGTKDNAAALNQSLGRMPTPTDLIAAWFLGPAGATKFLQADPNTPVDQVVDPAALAANRSVFYNADGSPRTVGQVYAAEAQKIGASPTMPGGGGAQRASTGAPGTQALFGPQQQAIAAYQAGQPAMWAKLQAMQDDYKKASTPTAWDRLSDAMSKMQQQQAIADANMHASAGAILNGQNILPAGQAFAESLKSGHDIDLQERQARIDQARLGYEMGSKGLLAQDAQQLANLGLTGDLAKTIATYGQTGRGLDIQQQQANTQQQQANTQQQVANQTYEINKLKYGAEVATGLADYVGKQVTNLATRNWVNQQLAQRGVQGGSLAANQKIADDIIGEAQKQGMQLAQSDPSKMQVVSWNEKDPATGDYTTHHEPVDLTTDAGRARVKELGSQPGFTLTNPGATQVSMNPTINTGTQGGGGGRASASLGDQMDQNLSTQSTITAAQEVLAAIQKAGGSTGKLTDSGLGANVMNLARSLGFVDPNTATLHDLWGKLMTEIQTGIVMPQLMNFGARPAQMEYQTLLNGTVGPDKSPAAAAAFLDHVAAGTKWHERMLEAQIDAEHEAHVHNDTAYNPNVWKRNWLNAKDEQGGYINRPPAWNLLGITSGSTPAKSPPGPAGGAVVRPPVQPPAGAVAPPPAGAVAQPPAAGAVAPPPAGAVAQPPAGAVAQPARGGGIPQRPQSVPSGSQYNPARQQWRDEQGVIYDANGNPISAATRSSPSENLTTPPM